MSPSHSIRPVSLHITVDRIVVEPAASRARAPEPARERVRVRPRMYGDQMFYIPERSPARAAAPASNPIADFFNWLFGYSHPQA